ARDFQQEHKIACSIQDSLLRNARVFRGIDCIINARIIILLIGSRTSSEKNKSSLLEENKIILDSYIEYLEGKLVVIATNPCTELGHYLESRINCNVIG